MDRTRRWCVWLVGLLCCVGCGGGGGGSAVGIGNGTQFANVPRSVANFLNQWTSALRGGDYDELRRLIDPSYSYNGETYGDITGPDPDITTETVTRFAIGHALQSRQPLLIVLA